MIEEKIFLQNSSIRVPSLDCSSNSSTLKSCNNDNKFKQSRKLKSKVSLFKSNHKEVIHQNVDNDDNNINDTEIDLFSDKSSITSSQELEIKCHICQKCLHHIEKEEISSGDQERTNQIVAELEVHNQKWSQQDDVLLKKFSAILKLDWKKISAKMVKAGRQKFPPHFLKYKYNQIKSLQNPEQQEFTKEEDVLILDTIEKEGMNWGKIYEVLPHIEPTRIRNRYYQKLRKIKKGKRR